MGSSIDASLGMRDLDCVIHEQTSKIAVELVISPTKYTEAKDKLESAKQESVLLIPSVLLTALKRCYKWHGTVIQQASRLQISISRIRINEAS